MKRSQRGLTLVEIVAVVAVISVLAIALWPLVKSTYDSWVTADRRGELVQTGRVGMHKLTQEIRRAYDMWSATDPTYLDYFPSTATSTQWRFKYNNAAYEIDWSASSTFVTDSLAAPIDSFLYKTYTRRLVSNVTRARRVNAVYFLFGVSDERRKLTSPVVPMYFRSLVNLRTSRAGYMLSKSNAYATQSYLYTRANPDQFCVKTFCDMTDPLNVTTKDATLDGGGLANQIMTLTYFPTGDYYAACCTLNAAGCFRSADVAASVMIDIIDSAGETCHFEETVRIN